MAKSERPTTIVSTNGQAVPPRSTRGQRRVEVEGATGGTMLETAPIFALTRPENVYASLACACAPKALEEMEAGIAVEAKRRQARHRY